MTIQQWWRGLAVHVLTSIAAGLGVMVSTSWLSPELLSERPVLVTCVAIVTAAASAAFGAIVYYLHRCDLVKEFRPRVLLVDDDVELCAIIVESIPECDFTLAHRCDAAKVLIDTNMFDAYVVDIRLPDCNGLCDLLPYIRQRSAAKVAVITGHVTSADIVNYALTFGMCSFLAKDPGTLFYRELRQFLTDRVVIS